MIDQNPETVTPPSPIAGAKKQSALVQFSQQGGLQLNTMEDAFLFARAVIEGGLAPKDFKTPQAVLVAVQMGAELGLPPMASLQNIAVINGRPSVWGDAMVGIVQASGQLEDYKDEMVGTGDARAARVTVRRKGYAESIVRTFGVADAKKAGLWGKQGPWSLYPERMMLMRARSWALRDAFPDKLRGVLAREEAQDLPADIKNVTPPAPSATLRALDAPVAEAAPEATGAETITKPSSSAECPPVDSTALIAEVESHLLDLEWTEAKIVKHSITEGWEKQNPVAAKKLKDLLPQTLIKVQEMCVAEKAARKEAGAV